MLCDCFGHFAHVKFFKNKNLHWVQNFVEATIDKIESLENLAHEILIYLFSSMKISVPTVPIQYIVLHNYCIVSA